MEKKEKEKENKKPEKKKSKPKKQKPIQAARRENGSFIRKRNKDVITKAGKFKKVGPPCPVDASSLGSLHDRITKQKTTNKYSNIKKEFRARKMRTQPMKGIKVKIVA